MPPPMDELCAEKLRLLSEFQKATRLYSTRVGAMEEATAGIIPTAEFVRLNKIATEAREKSLDAYERFQKHQAEHGC